MSGIDTDRLERARARLGDAVVDPAVWPEIIDQISVAVKATGGVLLPGNGRMPDVPRSAGLDELVKTYFENGWHLRDLRTERGRPLLLKGDKVITDQDIITAQEMRRFAFYNEFLARQGFKWFAAVSFWVDSELWLLSIQRTMREGPFEAIDKCTLSQLSRPLANVASLSTAVGRIALSSVTNALNLVCQPAIAIDRFGFVLDANAGAEALFDAHIRVKSKRLVVSDAEAKSCLENLVDCLRVTPDVARLPCEPIIVRHPERGPVILNILPVHGAARSPFLGARALLTLTVAEPKPAPKAALLGGAFGLTPAESRLASIIAEGRSLERAAEELRISKATARNQLREVFTKTDTHRQGELIALLSRL